jgi:probable rRNA maturation factor
MIRNQIYVHIKRGLHFPFKRAWLKSIVIHVLKLETLKGPYEISLAVTDCETIQELNREYRKIDSPTDVLSFTLTKTTPAYQDTTFISPPDSFNHLGEIVIAYPFTVQQAHLHHNTVDQEMKLLIVHGILHLLGYDHENAMDSRKMRKREKHILDLIDDAADTK